MKVEILLKIIYLLMDNCVIPLDTRLKIHEMLHANGFYVDDKNETISEIR